jgi:hypothetical protein
MLRGLLYKAFALTAGREVKALERDSRNPRAAQLSLLLDILKRNADTEYGQKHGFASIKSIEDFQNAVPINDYDSLQPYINAASEGRQNVLTAESPFMFATTSGTTGSRKLIPITRAYVKEFRRASIVSGFNLLKHYPSLAKGVSLSVFSPAEEDRTSAGIPCGAISGRLYLEEPKFIKKYVSPIPYEVFLIQDYESRYYTLLRLALILPITSIYTLNPSTIIILGRRLTTYASALIKDIDEGTLNPPKPLPEKIEKAVRNFLKPQPKRAAVLRSLLDQGEFLPHKVWSDLSLISCWTKAAAAFYLQDFPHYFGDLPVCDITYGASEGRGTVCLSPTEQMLSIRSHFFEFVLEEEMANAHPRVYVVDELEIGKSYFILFTTSGGLYRYNLNDIVKVVGVHNQTPLLEFMHKGGNISSFTGEKITESQVTNAVAQAARDSGFRVSFFTVVPEFRPEPHYQLWIELTKGENSVSADEAEQLAIEVDTQLGLHNIEYATKRESHRLAPLTVRVLRSGIYEDLRKQMVAGGVPDAQIKISHLQPKDSIKQSIESLSKV